MARHCPNPAALSPASADQPGQPEPAIKAAEQAAGEPELAVWEFAGLMITYWCNARCAFCYVYSGPDRGGTLAAPESIHLWRGLDRLAAHAGKRMRIHLAGGEPLGDWPHLAAIVRAARDAGLSRLEKVETNAFWAVQDGLTRARLELLDALGMEKLVISADVYHQEFVPLERVSRCVRIARQVLGRGRVIVRWWDFLADPVETRRLSPGDRQEAYRAALARHQDRLTGRAADRLSDFFPLRPLEHFRGQACAAEVLRSRHVHIDPYQNVFPGVCSGIILGNAAQRGIEALWHELAATWRDHPVVGAVVAGGSYELARRAQALGFRPRPEGYANKCHLCTHVRQFLFERGIWPEAVGPAECYANERDRKEADAARALVHLTRAGRPAGEPPLTPSARPR